MSKLFEALQLNSVTLPNRLVVSPMCQYSAQDGYPTDWHFMHLGQFAAGKAGAIIQEATAISPEGRISYWDLGLWADEQIESYKKITSFIQSQGAIAGIQLAHAGRKASMPKPWEGRKQYTPEHQFGWETIAPSAIGYYEEDQIPQELSIEQINLLITHFQKATSRAVKAGYQIIEIHAAHGYLIHQFLSPLVNKRTDEYGGSFENRIRLLLEIIKAVKIELSAQSLWVRISATDWAEGGWNLEESIQLCERLHHIGVEVIDVSSGGAVRHQEISVQPGYQVPFSSSIKSNVPVLTAAVGLITEAHQAENIILDQHADLVLMGRKFLENPHLVYDWAKKLNVDLNWAPQYSRAK